MNLAGPTHEAGPDAGMPVVRPEAKAPSQRLPLVDLVRGLAIVQMVAYHFIYDLSYFGWVRIDLARQAGWIAWRSAIVSQFLLVLGIGIGLGDSAGGRAPVSGAAGGRSPCRRRSFQSPAPGCSARG